MAFLIEKWFHAVPGNARGHRVIVKCPKCNLQLALTHDVDAAGIVTPSLVCTHDGCDFHEWVQLKGYPDEPTIRS